MFRFIKPVCGKVPFVIDRSSCFFLPGFIMTVSNSSNLLICLFHFSQSAFSVNRIVPQKFCTRLHNVIKQFVDISGCGINKLSRARVIITCY